MSAEQTPPVQLVTVTIDGLAKLVQWVAAGETFDERQRRGELAKQAVERCLNAAARDLDTKFDNGRKSDQVATAWPPTTYLEN